MSRAAGLAVAVVIAGCGGGVRAPSTPLRAACAPATVWAGRACVARGDGAARIAAGADAVANTELEVAARELDAGERAGQLDLATHVRLWEQRALAASYADDATRAAAAFEMMLAIDPAHTISYKLTTKVVQLFEEVRQRSRQAAAPQLEVRWPRGLQVGARIPLDLEVVSDPRRFLHSATVFVRRRGEARWRAADVSLVAREAAVVLPAFAARGPLTLDLYLRAYDARGNEVLAWADPARPRELPLRYDPPPPWYRRPWVIAGAASVLAVATGVAVYALTREPPDRVDGSVTVE